MEGGGSLCVDFYIYIFFFLPDQKIAISWKKLRFGAKSYGLLPDIF